MTDVTLLHGDCLELMPTLPAQSVQMVFADLPYGVTRCKWDLTLNQTLFWTRVNLLLTPKALLAATTDIRLAGELMKNATIPFRYDLVMHKSRPVGFLNAKKMPLRAHELILIFGFKGHTYNVVKEKSLKTRPASTFVRAKKTDVYGSAHKNIAYTYDDTRYPTSVVQPESPARERGLHPTQKPVALLEWLIKTYTNPGDTVLDPVAGSGTTAIAAMRTGRRAICIEKDATYFAAMTKRVENERARMVQAPLAI